MRINNRIVCFISIIWLATLGCNLPTAGPQQDPANPALPSDNLTTFTPISQAQQAPQIPASSPTSTFTSTPCSPFVTANVVANVRNGPGTVYDIVGSEPLGGTAPVAGKNSDGTWWYIQFAGGPGGLAWIASSVTTANCIPTTLAFIAAPPTPTAPPTPKPTKTASPAPFVPPPLPPPAIATDIVPLEVFLSTGGEIVIRIGIDPAGTLSGNFKYKVLVDGTSIGVFTDSLPSGSAAYWTGHVLYGPGTYQVKVIVDSNDAYYEFDESNNTLVVTCDPLSGICS